MEQHELVRINHILDAVIEIVDFTNNRTRSDLEKDRMLVLALTRLSEIMGEAANGVSGSIQRDHPEVPWRQIISLRHRLIHGYFDIENDIIWHTVTHDVPPLIGPLKEIIRRER
jgi:uncharacterized protein with HEPN domain